MAVFDVVVVGGGPSGEEAAGRLAGNGLSVALIEDRLVGGECAHWACVPSKALLRPYEALAEARRIAGAREAVTGDLDVAAVLKRRDEIIGAPDDNIQVPWVRSHGIELIRGHGRIIDERKVLANDQEIEAERAVVLAGGSLPLVPGIEGLGELGSSVWTNREATTTQTIPRRMLIMGGGPVGVEMAQIFQTLGSQVTVIEGQHRLLPHQEDFAGEQVHQALQAIGVDVLLGHSVVRFSKGPEGEVVALTSAEMTVTGDVVLVAVGRKPATEDLGVEILGFEPGSYLEVDANMSVVGHPWLYAIGDTNGRALFTSMGKYQGRLAADHILGRPSSLAHAADGILSPHVTFTDPQVASVGHTTESATAAGIEFDSYDTPTSGQELPNLGGLFYAPGAPGTARILVDRKHRVLIGATITGSEIVDLVHAASVAIVAKIPLATLRHAVPPFPTRSELWLSLLEQAGA